MGTPQYFYFTFFQSLFLNVAFGIKFLFQLHWWGCPFSPADCNGILKIRLIIEDPGNLKFDPDPSVGVPFHPSDDNFSGFSFLPSFSFQLAFTPLSIWQVGSLCPTPFYCIFLLKKWVCSQVLWSDFKSNQVSELFWILLR